MSSLLIEIRRHTHLEIATDWRNMPAESDWQQAVDAMTAAAKRFAPSHLPDNEQESSNISDRVEFEGWRTLKRLGHEAPTFGGFSAHILLPARTASGDVGMERGTKSQRGRAPPSRPLHRTATGGRCV
ncbi:MAG: hypothetical protein HC888_19935 [Candidatus Competibacteraceae bacterium]|nr:hypothetical protein [Candidatus Competibacteraceae bacterium]